MDERLDNLSEVVDIELAENHVQDLVEGRRHVPSHEPQQRRLQARPFHLQWSFTYERYIATRMYTCWSWLQGPVRKFKMQCRM